MNAREAFARLLRLKAPVVGTADAAAALGQSTYAASKTLSRLAESGLVTAVRHGTWWVGASADPYRLPEYLTSPMPSYLSLHTALHLRGMVEQIPEVFYVVSLARTKRIVTSAGMFSVHHIAPELYGGFEEMTGGIKLATAEKALFDLAYLSGGRSRLFTAVPELEIGKGFRWRELRRWVRRVPVRRARTLVEERLEQFVGGRANG
jgi:predicted transcriptional regulator of viral defense system